MVDFAAEGLLDGLEGPARAARERLLQALVDDGATLDEVRAAVADGTLFMLPSERSIGGRSRYTLDEVARLSGLDREFLVDLRRSAGLPAEDDGARDLTDVDLDAARTAKAYADAGIPPEAQIEVARIFGRAMSQAADALRRLALAMVFDPDADEHELAMRYADFAVSLEPTVGPTMQQLLRMHLRHAVRTELLEAAEEHGGVLAGQRDVAVGFADLVGFTRVGEQVAPDELGAIAERLETLATSLVAPPVRVVKTIGDAVLIVSPTVDDLIDVALRLVAAADAEGPDFPQLRAGIAYGPALQRAGDWYGRPVNLASRLTALARPGTVLCDQAARDAAQGRWRWRSAGQRRVRNVSRPVRVHRVRPPQPPAGEPG